MRFVRIVALVAVLVLVAGCAGIGKKPYVFEPQESGGLVSYYVNGQPYATASDACGNLTVSLSPSVVSGASYARVFLQYENTSDDVFLLQPLQALKLEVISEKGKAATVEPRSPSEMRHRIEAAKSGALFGQLLMGAVSAAAVYGATVSGPGGAYRIDDAALGANAIAQATATDMIATSISSDLLASAISRCVLRRHTLFPGGDVAGFAFFPLSGFGVNHASDAEELSRAMKDKRYVLSFEGKCGRDTVRFVPVEGE